MGHVGHIYTIREVAHAALRLVAEGTSLKHAVNLSASAFGFEPEDIYIEIAKLDKQKGIYMRLSKEVTLQRLTLINEYIFTGICGIQYTVYRSGGNWAWRDPAGLGFTNIHLQYILEYLAEAKGCEVPPYLLKQEIPTSMKYSILDTIRIIALENTCKPEGSVVRYRALIVSVLQVSTCEEPAIVGQYL